MNYMLIGTTVLWEIVHFEIKGGCQQIQINRREYFYIHSYNFGWFWVLILPFCMFFHWLFFITNADQGVNIFCSSKVGTEPEFVK